MGGKSPKSKKTDHAVPPETPQKPAVGAEASNPPTKIDALADEDGYLVGEGEPSGLQAGAKPEPPPLPETPDLFDQIEDWAQEKFDSGFEKQRQAITTEFEGVFGKKV